MPTHAPWSKFFSDLPMHRQTAILREELEKLGMSREWSYLCYAYIGPLNCWALANAEDGNVSHLTAEQFAAVCGWRSKRTAGGFRDAMLKAGFLIRAGDGSLHVKNLTTYHASLLADRRYHRARRQASGDASGDTSGVSGRGRERGSGSGREGTQTQSATAPSRSVSPSAAQDAALAPWPGRCFAAYPRQEAKALAFPSVAEAVEVLAPRFEQDRDRAGAWLLSRIEAFARSPAGKQGRFTPTLTTWLKGGRYDDADEAWNLSAPQRDPAGGSRPGRLTAPPGKYARFRTAAAGVTVVGGAAPASGGVGTGGASPAG
jgi:hypothetical protein